MFSFFGNSEKSEIEREHRNTVGNLPYQLPYELKNKITRLADNLKDLKMRRYEKKTNFLERQEQEEKRETDLYKRDKNQIEQRYERELNELSRKHDREMDEIKRRYEREISSLESSDRYNQERLERDIKDCQKEIEEWQRNKGK